MGDGTRENPYTSKDVLRLIMENGGKAKGLDLSEKHFDNAIDLSGLELNGIIFRESIFHALKATGARFDGSSLVRANFCNAELEYAQFKPLEDFRGSHLMAASFQGAKLSSAQFGETEDKDLTVAALDETDFRDANLLHTNFKGCYFYGTKFEGAYIRGNNIAEAHLEEADWGSYRIGEETEKHELHFAEHVYRQMKKWYTEAGMYDVAAKFYYREKEAGRKSLRFYFIQNEAGKKSLKLLPKNWRHRVALQLSYWVFGHGEGWKRLFFWMAGFILFFALIYVAFDSTREWRFFGDYLYFSAVSFTALGYGNWLPVTNNWIRGLGAFESFIGVFSMALFLVTFIRKMTR
jgi:hypothetical protein